jgi:gamma-glutamyltranspeptidase/glutathione hydrolase
MSRRLVSASSAALIVLLGLAGPAAAEQPAPAPAKAATTTAKADAGVAPAAPVATPSPAAPAPAKPFHAAHAAVASDHPLASAAGVAALKAGGNAIDAACAAALALGVVHPDSSGIGGGGFALVYVAKEKKVYALDFRERAPAGITPAAYLDGGKLVPKRSQEGGLAVAVPGELRGLEELVKRWGARPFRSCVDPAQKLAAKGFPVSWRLASTMATLAVGTKPADPVFAKMFIPAKPLAEKATMKRPELAATLAKVRAGGANAFYKGPIADEIVKAVKAAGGVMTLEDLAAYAPKERAPLAGRYHDLEIFTMPPPSSGGVALLETLNILQTRYASAVELPKGGTRAPAFEHTLVESFKHAFADRARFLGDTDFVQVDVPRLTSAPYALELSRRIKPNGVLPSDAYGSLGPPPAAHGDHGTTHLSVIDAAGNAVALTSTINLAYGAKLIAGKTGVLLNDQMDDFVIQVGAPNAFGLIGNEQNLVAPKKTPLSSMTPTIALEGGKVKLVVGAAGGPNIITSTAQAFLNVVDGKMDAQAAVSAPRLHHQWFPETLALETTFPRDVADDLAKRGHKLKELPASGKVNLLVRADDGIDAAAEPRSPSQPAGY